MTERLSVPGGDVSVLFEGPRSGPLLILGHGAGGDLHSSFMDTIAGQLGQKGVLVCRFNFLYSDAGRKAPDKQTVLEETFTAVVDQVRSRSAGRVFIGGKSMGGRIASHIAAEGVPVDGLVFLGYPLHPPGRPERIRDAHLRDIGAPMLFVEGTRDPFCPLETLERVRASLSSPTDLVVIDDGDHSFKVRKSSGRATADAWLEVSEAVATWMQSL